MIKTKEWNKKRALGIKGIAYGLSAVLLLGMLAGCGGAAESSYKNGSANAGASTKSASYSANYDEAAYDVEYSSQELWSEGEGSRNGDSSSENISNTSASKRKLIKNVNMKVETQEYDKLMANLEARVKELGGYIQNLESYNGSNYEYSYSKSRRYANAVIRIPQQKLDEFVGSVSDMANVVNRSESVEDVTLKYVDMQSHKESLQVEQQRLLALLEKAEILEDIITLENRLTNVRYQIESMESQLRTFDDMVDYSTVSLRVDEVVVYTKVEEEEETPWQRMTNGFMESLISVKDGFVEFGIWFVVNIPYLVIWAIVITIGVSIFKRIRHGKSNPGGKKSRKQRRNAQGAETEQTLTDAQGESQAESQIDDADKK